MRHETIEDLVATHLPPKAYAEQWDIEGLTADVPRVLGPGAADRRVGGRGRHRQRGDRATASPRPATAPMARRRLDATARSRCASVEKSFLLQMIDQQWREHLMHLDHLRQVIGLRGYGQRDPLNEYKTEAFSLFEGLLDQPADHGQPGPGPPRDPHRGTPAAAPAGPGDGTRPRPRGSLAMAGGGDADVNPADPSTWGRVRRNAPCPCGSGRKYKQCHGRLA